MRGYCLGFACPLEHEELWQDRDRLEENGERPQDLGEVEVVIENEGQYDAGTQQVFNAERVNRGVVCWSVVRPGGQESPPVTRTKDSPETVFHNVEDVGTACNEEQLHDEVVQRNPTEEQVKVARHKNASI